MDGKEEHEPDEIVLDLGMTDYGPDYKLQINHIHRFREALRSGKSLTLISEISVVGEDETYASGSFIHDIGRAAIPDEDRVIKIKNDFLKAFKEALQKVFDNSEHIIIGFSGELRTRDKALIHYGYTKGVEDMAKQLDDEPINVKAVEH